MTPASEAPHEPVRHSVSLAREDGSVREFELQLAAGEGEELAEEAAEQAAGLLRTALEEGGEGEGARCAVRAAVLCLAEPLEGDLLGLAGLVEGELRQVLRQVLPQPEGLPAAGTEGKPGPAAEGAAALFRATAIDITYGAATLAAASDPRVARTLSKQGWAAPQEPLGRAVALERPGEAPTVLLPAGSAVNCEVELEVGRPPGGQLLRLFEVGDEGPTAAQGTPVLAARCGAPPPRRRRGAAVPPARVVVSFRRGLLDVVVEEPDEEEGPSGGGCCRWLLLLLLLASSLVAVAQPALMAAPRAGGGSSGAA